MNIMAAGDPDRFESELAARAARARRVLVGVTLGLLGAGALCGALALVLALPVHAHPGLFGVLSGVGLALVVAGVASALQLRGRSLAAADDALGRLAPRILGGQKPDALDRHRRRRRPRRGRG